jgi:L-alanine-DL-glutamate epimerase-like enolase superfamily enzyme
LKIRSISVTTHSVKVTEPYAIASGTTDAVELAVVRVESESGVAGYGAATPEPTVTGETFAACRAALDQARTRPLVGGELDRVGELCRTVERDWRETPGAAAALDSALRDLHARTLGLPLVELLGRAGDLLPTSVTIGILGTDETVARAERHVANGFRALKLKIGRDLDGDLERIAAVRETVGPRVALRVDGNCGYRAAELPKLLAGCAAAEVELVEQPCAPEEDDELRALGAAARRALVADESIHSPADALRLAAGEPLYGGFVVKLMKCGGVTPALKIAAIAAAAGLDLMWGCMDESAIGIAAALHAAYASPATRWLDLDGSFDLAHDPGTGGFALAGGRLSTLSSPGLGVELS